MTGLLSPGSAKKALCEVETKTFI